MHEEQEKNVKRTKDITLIALVVTILERFVIKNKLHKRKQTLY